MGYIARPEEKPGTPGQFFRGAGSRSAHAPLAAANISSPESPHAQIGVGAVPKTAPERFGSSVLERLAGLKALAETERALLKPPAAWEAYEYYLRGAEAFFLYMTRRTKALLYEARQLLEQSLAIDPNYARAAAMLSRPRC